MNGFLPCFPAITAFFLACAASSAQDSDRFTPLEPLDTPTIIAASESYPGGSYEVANMIDGRVLTEHSSASKGTETFIDFDLGRPVAVAGFRHTDRRDLATIKSSRLVFSNTPDFDDPLATAAIEHANTPGGRTRTALPNPVTARYVRWQVTALGPRGYGTVGGAEIGFFTAGESQAAPTRDRVTVRGTAALLRGEGPPVRPVRITVEHPYGREVDAVLRITGLDPTPIHLRLGSQSVEISLAAEGTAARIEVALEVAGKEVAKSQLTLEPVRHWEFSFLPHSHVDIGYTHVQTEVEQKQWGYLEMAIDIARRTADYPAGAKFHWNSETLWAVDSYLKQASDEQREAFLEAVRKEWIHLDALYGNELTALCRPEELMRLVDCARRISREHDVTIDSAMISDVPGYTWGLVPALAQSGVKYLSIGPNHVHRIGRTLDAWGDRPFYWVSPSGDDRVLCWMAGKAYSWFHASRVNTLTAETAPDPFFEYLAELEDADYPYDMVQVRYSIGGDNGPPDQQLCEFVKAWNAKYVWPRMAITTTSRLMHEFEDRYGEQIPEVSGDFTPYWEDGAGSSAKETAMARNAAERLVQAEALWSLLAPSRYPGDDFYSAWRDVILYNEHTWGAHCSISRPDDPFTLSQWAIKQAFALDAEEKSKKLLDALRPAFVQSEPRVVTAVDVYNTTSWPRSDLVRVHGLSLAGNRVTDAAGQAVVSEPFRSLGFGFDPGLAFVARDVPPLGAKRFFLSRGDPHVAGSVKAEGAAISNGVIRVRVDEETGAIAELTYRGIPVNLADTSNGGGLNNYHYVAGRDRENVETNDSVEFIHVETSGLLEASLMTVSNDVPGGQRLGRIVSVIDGLDRVDVINTITKEKVLSPESVHFAFPFNVPDGVMRMDTPWAVVRPEVDQLPGACKNYFTVGRWVDISNDSFGVTWATPDAPLVEVGAITVDVNGPFDPENWIEHIAPSQTFFSYVMNNYWETNYKASQEGTVTFRYSIRPHAEYDPVAAARFGVERSQPLIVMPADPDSPVVESRLRIDAPSVMVTSLKPSEDGKALIVRLFNVGDAAAAAELTWSEPRPTRVTRSGPGEQPGHVVDGPIELAPMGIVTLRAEMP